MHERGIPDRVRDKIVKLALKETELSPRELAVTFTVNRRVKRDQIAA